MDNDEFGMSSDDEAELLAIANHVESSPLTKRKASNDDDLLPPPAKRLATAFPSATRALKRDFGLEAFRLKQEQVVARILTGESAVVVFPTGGGKSLCYQVPALVFSEEDILAGKRNGDHGITLVVSPLIALMKDQVDALLRRGIKAATLDSTKTREEYLHTCDMMRNGELKILYCAPERLNNEGFVEQMKFVRGGIRLLAVDEAHCISEWGHAFRPDYLKISRFVKEIKAERVICLTATATPRVAKDICKAFDIPEEGLFRTSTYRPNLHLLAESAPTKNEIYPRLFKFLRENKGASIVYVTLQKHTEELAARLNREGFHAKAFHAGMETKIKTHLQDEFMRRNDLIIVATIAFGMGIDKANIRNVIHMNIPSSLESYSQEIGRAGRDGLKSNCVFYVCGEDLHLRELFARGDLASLNSTRFLLNDIFTSSGDDSSTPHNKRPVGAEIKFSHYTQERDFDMRGTTLKNIYAQLELTHGLIRQCTPQYTKYTFLASSKYESCLASDKSDAGRAIRAFSKKAAKFHHIDVEAAAASLHIERPDIVRKLNDWSSEGVIELKPSGVLNVYKITNPLPKTAGKIQDIANDLYRTMESREKEAMHRTDEMIALITGKKCFSLALANHFGDCLPDGRIECGHCQWCLTHEAIQLQTPPAVEFNKLAFNSILSTVKDRDDPRLLARIAFGIHSPRVTLLKLGRHPIFGSMEDHEFMHLLKSFTTVCDKGKNS